ncbi:MAG: ornithine carbamoyltransferase [Bacillota bacterium]
MVTSFRGKHLITLQDWTKQEIDTCLDTAYDLKLKFARRIPHASLRDETVFMLFFDNSTRTRNSTEAGATQLGAHAHDLDASKMQIGHGDNAKDTATILSSYGHAIACRHCGWDIGNRFMEEMAKYSRVPILNMQSDLYHPMQGLADLMTIEEVFGRTKVQGVKVSVIWCYSTTHKKPISVPVSQVLLFPRYGMEVTLAYPEGFELPDWVIEQARKNAEACGGSIRITHDLKEAYENADVVFPKNWGSWYRDSLTETQAVERKDNTALTEEELTRLAANKKWKCTEELFSLTSPRCVYMHALPADRDNEVEDSVIDGERSVIYQEAENRLHTVKAIMDLTMGGRS